MRRLSQRHLAIAGALTACTKEITVDLPPAEEKLLVNGTIEPGQPAIVVVTRTESFFEPTDFQSLLGIFVKTAPVTVDNGNGPVQLARRSGFDITGTTLERAAQMIGIDPQIIQVVDLTVYVDTTGMVGEAGRTYSLNVQAEGKTVTGSSFMRDPEPLDSLWFKLVQQDPGDDSLGFIWQTTSHPPGLGEIGELIGGFNSLIAEVDVRESALRESDDCLRSILSTSLDGFWRVSQEGRLLESNETYARMSGYTIDELLGMHVSQLVANESPVVAAERHQRIIATGRLLFEDVHRRKDGSVWYIESNATYRPGGGGQVVAFIRDIYGAQAR